MLRNENQPGLCFVQLENTVRLIFERGEGQTLTRFLKTSQSQAKPKPFFFFLSFSFPFQLFGSLLLPLLFLSTLFNFFFFPHFTYIWVAALYTSVLLYCGSVYKIINSSITRAEKILVPYLSQSLQFFCLCFSLHMIYLVYLS